MSIIRLIIMIIMIIMIVLLITIPASAQELVWEQTNGPYGGDVISLLATPDGTLFAGIGIGRVHNPLGAGGIYRSEDKGNSWIAVNNGLPKNRPYDWNYPIIFSLAAMGKTIFAGTSQGVYRSEDNGNTWVEAGLTFTQVRSFAVMGTTLFAGTGFGVYRSEDNGDTWTAANNAMANSLVLSLAVMDTTLFAGLILAVESGVQRIEATPG